MVANTAGTERNEQLTATVGVLLLERPDTWRGEAGRWIALSSACALGLVLALVLLPDFSVWTNHGVLAHHHRG